MVGVKGVRGGRERDGGSQWVEGGVGQGGRGGMVMLKG